MQRILIASAIFLVEVTLAVALFVAPLLRDISNHDATGIGFLMSPQNIVKLAVGFFVFVALAAWISGRIFVGKRPS